MKSPLLKNKTSLVIISICLFLIGMFIVGKIFTSAKENIIVKNDEHIIEVANSIDHNVDVTLRSVYKILDTIVDNPNNAKQEEEYLVNKETESLKIALADYLCLMPDYIHDVIFFSDVNDVISVSGNNYNLVDYDLSADICFLKDENGDYNDVLRYEKSSYSDLYYGIVMDFASLYKHIVDPNVYSSYWVVMHDDLRNITFQNSLSQSIFAIMSKDEMDIRNDGYTEILKCEQENRSQIVEYTSKYDNKLEMCRMYVIPKDLTINSMYSIAISVYKSQITSDVNKWSIAVFISSLLITFSIFLIIIVLFRTNAKEYHLNQKNNELNKELSEKNQKLLDLEHHQKLETIGTLTTGIAHEFNNLLAPIMADSLLALENVSEDNTALYDNLVDIYNSSKKAKDLVYKITKLSRKSSKLEMKVVSPVTILDNVIKIVKSSLSENVTIEKDYNCDAKILADESQLEYMFINLIKNADQAMEKTGGIIRVVCSNDEEFVYLSIEDEGPGIDENLLDTIFEPFFTTKEAGKGTGLGLSIAQQTANDHGGKLTVRNKMSKGAIFTFTIHAFKQ